MKALLLYALVFLLSTSTATAQLYVGPLAGAQLSWTKFDNRDYYDSYKLKPIWGYHAGVNMSLKVRNRFFLHTSLIYSSKGRKLEGRQDPLLRDKVTYKYLEVPIIYAVDFKAQLGKGKEFKYYLGAGPTISYWLGGKGKLYNSDLNENAEFSAEDLAYTIAFNADRTDAQKNEMNVADPNRIQLGLNIASGLVFEPQPNQRILIMLRYELGHSFLSREGNGTFIPTYYEDILQSRNKGIRLSVSYMIDLRIENRKRGKSNSKIGGKRRG
jgi:hypothetical protein